MSRDPKMSEQYLRNADKQRSSLSFTGKYQVDDSDEWIPIVPNLYLYHRIKPGMLDFRFTLATGEPMKLFIDWKGLNPLTPGAHPFNDFNGYQIQGFFEAPGSLSFPAHEGVLNVDQADEQFIGTFEFLVRHETNGVVRNYRVIATEVNVSENVKV